MYNSSVEIYEIGKKLFGNKFKGVYPLEKIPKYLKNGFYVINTQTSNLPGEHWLAIDVRSYEIKVFDSFGFFYPQELLNRVFQTGKQVTFNRIRYQNPFTTSCGQLCLLWFKRQSM